MPWTVNPDHGYLEYRDGGGGDPDVEQFTTDVAGPVTPAAGVVTVTGTNIYSDGSVANTLTLNNQATANTILYGAGPLSPMLELGPLTDGQLIIGATGSAPAAGSITSTDGSITISTGAGTIDLAVAAADDAILTLTGDAGGALSPTAGNINILGSTVANATNAQPLYISGTGSTLTAQLQVATERTGAPGDNNDAGLASFSDTYFQVDSNGYVEMAQFTNGQLIIGNTGSDPTVGTLTEGTGIDITNGAGSITINFDVTEVGTIATTYTADSGSATPSANVLDFASDSYTYTSATGNTVTFGLTVPLTIPAGGTGLDGGTMSSGDLLFYDSGATDNFQLLNIGTQYSLLIASPLGAPAWLSTNFITTVTPDSGSWNPNTAVTGDATLVLAGGTGITTTGDTSTTVTIAIDNSVVGQTITGDSGGALSPTAGNWNIIGGSNIFTSGATSTLTVDVDATSNTFLYGQGSGSAMAELGPLTDGQLIIGATGGAPAAGSIASADGSVTVTAGTNSIDLQVDDAIKTNHTNGLGTNNLGLFYSAGTATIKGADGNNLSATNPGYVTIRSNVTDGVLVTYEMTSNKSFDDSAGTSVFAGSLFGFLTGDNSNTYISGTEAVPFFLYAALDSNDENLIFFTSGIPGYTNVSSTVFYNAASGSADLEWHQLALENVTVGNYQGNNAQLVGSFQMNINGLDDWTIDSVDSAAVGFGRYAQTSYGIPLGCKGAAANSIFLDNGGTAPTVTSGVLNYTMSIQGFMGYLNMSFNMSGTPAGAVDAQMVLPITGTAGGYIDAPAILSPSGTQTNQYPVRLHNQPTTDRYWYLNKEGQGTARWQYEEMSNLTVMNGCVAYRI